MTNYSVQQGKRDLYIVRWVAPVALIFVEGEVSTGNTVVEMLPPVTERVLTSLSTEEVDCRQLLDEATPLEPADEISEHPGMQLPIGSAGQTVTTHE